MIDILKNLLWLEFFVIIQFFILALLYAIYDKASND